MLMEKLTADELRTLVKAFNEYYANFTNETYYRDKPVWDLSPRELFYAGFLAGHHYRNEQLVRRLLVPDAQDGAAR